MREKIIFVFCLLSILFLFFLGEHLNKPSKGIVGGVDFFDGRIIINLESGERLVIFENRLLDIKKGDEILFWGKKEIYRGDEQIVVGRVEKVFRE